MDTLEKCEKDRERRRHEIETAASDANRTLMRLHSAIAAMPPDPAPPVATCYKIKPTGAPPHPAVKYKLRTLDKSGQVGRAVPSIGRIANYVLVSSFCCSLPPSYLYLLKYPS